ncbi:MAG: hypothetical protein AAGI01_15880, partial [Myxococcota bacterium]
MRTDPLEPDEIFERGYSRLDRGLVESVMLAGLRWSAVRWREHPILLDMGVECYRYLAGRFYDQGRRGFTHIPLFVVVDLLALIELGDRTPFASEEQASTWEPEERRLRIDYENLLLGTLLQEPAFVDARERMPSAPGVRHGASQRLVELLLQNFGTYYPTWYDMDPAHLRDIAVPTVGDINPEQYQARLDERLEDPAMFIEGIRLMLSGISSNVYWKDLLKSEDLFEIEHWAVLDTEATRIGVRQIKEVERRLGEFRLPRVRLRDEAMEVETDFSDDTTFPTGGFSGLATRGSFENLVRSELIYMGEGKPVSLFDLRFVESELLFYMRNDGVMRRKRRFVHVLVDLDQAFHAKSPGYEYPFATLTQGLISRLARDLLATFEEDAVTIDIKYHYRPSKRTPEEQVKREHARIERELSLLTLVLGREVRQERVRISLVRDIDPEEMQLARGRVYALAFVFNSKKEAFWRSFFEDMSHERHPVFGLTLPVGVKHVDPVAFEDEIPLVLPLDRIS